MTGHGTATVGYSAGRVAVDVRTVNHRFFETRIKLPLEDPSLGHDLDALLRSELKRGRAELVVRLEGSKSTAATLDANKVRALYAEWDALRRELAPDSAAPWSMLANAPGLYGSSDDTDTRDELRETILAAARAACANLLDMRRTEGAALASDLEARLSLIEKHVASIAEHARAAPASVLERTHARIVELIGAEPALEPARFVSELAMLVDKSDIAEELTRFASHIAQFRSAIRGSDAEGVGKRLDFLLQELSRETNTMGSKSISSGVTHLVIETKAELERIREQVQNIV